MNPRARSPKQKTPSGSPDPSWGIATGTLAVTSRAPIRSGLGAPGGGGRGLSIQPSPCLLWSPPAPAILLVVAGGERLQSVQPEQ